MMAAASRAIMFVAIHILGAHRSEWALAMQAEFEVAEQDGKSLPFAMGCLLTACGELPRHEEGRFVLVSHLLAVALIVPVAALMIASVLGGFPTSYVRLIELIGLLGIGAGQEPLLSEGNRSAIPSLAVLVLLLAALNLRIAWLALDRDWAALASAWLLSAAGTATLVVFSAVVFADVLAGFAQAALLIVQLGATSALARWHALLPSAEAQASLH